MENIKSGSIKTLQKVKEEGLAHAIGISGKTIEGGTLALSVGVDVLMVELNYDYKKELPLIKKAKEKNVGILLKKILKSGYLAKNQHSINSQIRDYYNIPGVTSLVIGSRSPKNIKENCSAIMV